MHEKPSILPLDFFTNLEHSRVDFPVVITSSTINTFEFFLILNPRLNLNFPLILSEKIVSTFNNFPISYPIIIPPTAGDKIKSILENSFFIFWDKDRQILKAFCGLLSNFAHWTYLLLCNPDDNTKCPLINALVSSKIFNDSFNEKYFENFRNEEVNILEIGIAKGDGLASFFYYFPNSKLIGLDNNPFRIRYKSNRIRHIFTDISSKKILSNLSKHINEKFDIIIEDCSHKLIDQILCFSHMFYKLKDGGYYIVEDLNFPEINKMHNPTNEDLNLKIILKKLLMVILKLILITKIPI